VAEALVAFANAEGGDLIIGVEDDGTITGVPHTWNEIRKILQAPESNVHKKTRLPMQVAARLELDGETLLLFSVLKGSSGVFQLSDGRCVRRDGLATAPESVETIMFE